MFARNSVIGVYECSKSVGTLVSVETLCTRGAALESTCDLLKIIQDFLLIIKGYINARCVSVRKTPNKFSPWIACKDGDVINIKETYFFTETKGESPQISECVIDAGSPTVAR